GPIARRLVGRGLWLRVFRRLRSGLRRWRNRRRDSRLWRRFNSWLGRGSRGWSVGRLRIYLERVLIVVEREFCFGRLGLDLRFFGLGRRLPGFIRRVPIDARQMRSEVAGRNVIDDFHRVCGWRGFFGMQKARRDEEHHREQRRVPERGDEDRREISDSRRLLVT